MLAKLYPKWAIAPYTPIDQQFPVNISISILKSLTQKNKNKATKTKDVAYQKPS